jgi:methyl-galactoside transport system substrate-binding protein
MKKSLLFLLIAAMCFLNACQESAEVEDQRVKIGISLYQAEDPFISSMKEEMIKVAKEQETADNVKIALYIMDASGQQSIQNEQVDQFIAKGYDAICINMVDRTAAAVIVDKAKAANIPLVFFNREPVNEDLEKWTKVCYVGARAEQSGAIQGGLIVNEYRKNRELIDKNNDGILQYVMLEGELGHQDALLRTEHSIKAITSAGIKVEKLANGAALWRRSLAKEKMAAWLGSFSDSIEVVISNNDEMALGALEALKEYNATNGTEILVHILGIDATADSIQAVKDREMFATVLNDEHSQARAVFELAYQMGIGNAPTTSVEGFDGKKLLTDYQKVDFSNVYEIK